MNYAGSKFQAWWDLNMQGFGVSDELEKLLAKAFEGGVEAATGMVKSDVQIVDIMGLGDAMRKAGGGINDVGTPQYVVMWPTPPEVRKAYELGKPIPTVRGLMDEMEECDYEDEDDYPVPSKARVLSTDEVTAASLSMLSKAFDKEYAKVDWPDILEETKKEAKRTRTPTKDAAKEQLEELRRRVTKVKY